MRAAYALGIFGLAALVGAAKLVIPTLRGEPLPTGKNISPMGDSTAVGSFPCNLTLSSDRKFILVTNSGFRENLSVLDASSGQLLSQLAYKASEKDNRPHALYFGLASHKMTDGAEWVAVSHGSDDQISIFKLEASGTLSLLKILKLPPGLRSGMSNPLHVPNHVAGLAWSKDGSRLYGVANQSHIFNDFHGSIFCLNVGSGALESSTPVGTFPLSICPLPSGDLAVTNEGGREIDVVREKGGITSIPTGEQPTYETLNHAGTKLYVSNSNSDTISEVDVTTHQVTRSVLLRLDGLRGFPGATPLGSVLSTDDRTLYVAMGDLNAVAVVDTRTGAVKGYIPTGWYPTSVALSGDGSSLFVANAKGVKVRNPNDKDVNGWGQYSPNILEGSVSKISLADATSRLSTLTKLVETDNHMESVNRLPFKNPGIRHVFYVIKENRTYDQVLGDMPQGNGDQSLTLFGKNITPNQHALAERFGLFDNFYVCAEVSADGWNWSTSGQANEYTERNVPYNYSGRGRSYDFEGTTNGTAADLIGKRDVAEAAGGYVWDAALASHKSVRNYGMFVSFDEPTKGPDGKPISVDNQPTRKEMVPITCTDFRKFDLSYPDSDAETKLNLPRAPRERVDYGSRHDHSRIETWLREFKRYVAEKNLPDLNLVRLPRNHTSGTSAGLPSPEAMVADNDYAVGELVDAVSHSPYWKSSAIFVVEDDAQDGFDHVDCHRSPTLVISPFTLRGKVDSTFYNTDSTLATIERILGTKPHNQYLATARPFDVFNSDSSNTEPYDAIVPDREIVGQVNRPSAYRSKDSSRLISLDDEESAADFELNDILWHSVKGVSGPRPSTRGVIWSGTAPDDD